MIGQCGQCKTKFRLDDAKIKDKGVKVRCSKCRHVFTVFRENLHDAPDSDLMLNSLSSAAGEEAVSQPTPTAQSPAAETPDTPDTPAAAPVVAASEEQPLFGDIALPDEGIRIDEFDFTDEGKTETTSLQEASSWGEGSGTAFGFSEPVEEEPAGVPEPPSP